MERLISALGVFIFLGIAWLLSNNKRQIDYRLVAIGLVLQFAFAFFILKTTTGYSIFWYLNAALTKVLGFSNAGVAFLFGKSYTELIKLNQPGASSLYTILEPSTGEFYSIGIAVAAYVLPTIIFFSTIMAILYHWGIMQKIVHAVGLLMARFHRTSGVESIPVIASSFIGPIEAALLIKPYLARMTNSELMALMTSGFATISGSFMMLYFQWGIPGRDLLAACLMSAPAALIMAKIIFPETEKSLARGVEITGENKGVNILDAAITGALNGLKIALHVAALILTFVALISLLDFGLIKFTALLNLEVSLQKIFEYIFAPIAMVMGIEKADALNVGYLLGTKITLSELFAYKQLIAWKQEISLRSYTIAVYALCSFANFSSIAVQVGGIGSIAPGRKNDLVRLCLKALIGGALASWLTGAIAGILI